MITLSNPVLVCVVVAVVYVVADDVDDSEPERCESGYGYSDAGIIPTKRVRNERVKSPHARFRRVRVLCQRQTVFSPILPPYSHLYAVSECL